MYRSIHGPGGGLHPPRAVLAHAGSIASRKSQQPLAWIFQVGRIEIGQPHAGFVVGMLAIWLDDHLGIVLNALLLLLAESSVPVCRGVFYSNTKVSP